MRFQSGREPSSVLFATPWNDSRRIGRLAAIWFTHRPSPFSATSGGGATRGRSWRPRPRRVRLCMLKRSSDRSAFLRSARVRPVAIRIRRSGRRRLVARRSPLRVALLTPCVTTAAVPTHGRRPGHRGTDHAAASGTCWPERACQSPSCIAASSASERRDDRLDRDPARCDQLAARRDEPPTRTAPPRSSPTRSRPPCSRSPSRRRGGRRPPRPGSRPPAPRAPAARPSRRDRRSRTPRCCPPRPSAGRGGRGQRDDPVGPRASSASFAISPVKLLLPAGNSTTSVIDRPELVHLGFGHLNLLPVAPARSSSMASARACVRHARRPT